MGHGTVPLLPRPQGRLQTLTPPFEAFIQAAQLYRDLSQMRSPDVMGSLGQITTSQCLLHLPPRIRLRFLNLSRLCERCSMIVLGARHPGEITCMGPLRLTEIALRIPRSAERRRRERV